MGAFLIFLLIFLTAIGIAGFLTYLFGRGEKKEAERDFKASLSGYKNGVKRYARKFHASLEHLIAIDNVFHELVESDKLKYLKPFEAYLIPTKRYYFSVSFYILTTENLEYRIVVYSGDVSTEKMVKKLLPYSMTLDEFDKFVEECKNENYNANMEKYRRDEVEKVLRKVNK